MKVLTDELGTAFFTKSAHDHDAVLKPWEEPADGGDLELALGLLRDARDRPALAADDIVNARHVPRHHHHHRHHHDIAGTTLQQVPGYFAARVASPTVRISSS